MVYSESDIDAAIGAGALSASAAAELRAFVAGTRQAPAVDEEHFRLITGFNDIFVSIAAVLLLVALSWIGGSLGGETGSPSPLGGVLVAGAAWGLAEFFTLRRRMALPSILLLLAFVGGVFFAVGALIIPHGNIAGQTATIALRTAVSAAFAAAAAWAHWRRFHVPITIAAGAAAVVGTALGLLLAVLPAAEDWIRPMMFAAGVAVFAFAMWWDMSDPARQTRRSDVAFWLHLLAAPLMVHPVFSLLGLLDGVSGAGRAAIVVILYVALGLVALAIDRRALMVSALAYVLYALSSLFREFGAVSLNIAFTALIIGSALLLLSAFWQAARAAVLRPLPDTLKARLPLSGRVALSSRPAS